MNRKRLKFIFLFTGILISFTGFTQNVTDTDEIIGKWKVNLEYVSDDNQRGAIFTFIKYNQCIVIENGYERKLDWELYQNELVLFFESQCGTQVQVYQISIKGDQMFWYIDDAMIFLTRI